MSKRVLDLAGFTFDDIHIEIEIPLDLLTPEYVAERSHSITDELVTCVCADCNNGWMQKLDHSFAGTVRRWVAKPSDRLGNTVASSLHYRSSKSSSGSSSDSRRNARRSGPTVKWHGSRGTQRTVNFRWARCARTSTQ